jgi:hypothetical protein
MCLQGFDARTPSGVQAHHTQDTLHILDVLVGLAREGVYLFIAVHYISLFFCYYKDPVQGSDVAEP